MMAGHERLILVPDDLWEAIEPLLPKEPPKPKGGRPRVPDRAALGGIIFVLRTGCPWRLLPKELGCGSGTTCWRRLRDWQEAGVWERLHDNAAELARRRSGHRLVPGQRGQPQRPGQKGGEQTGPNPVDRGKPGSKYHLVVDRNGIPLAVRLSAANAHDATQLLPLVDAIPPIIGPAGQTGSAAQAPGQTPRRQGLRLLGPAPCPACSRHHATHRPPRDRLQRAARAVPLGGRAHVLLAARLPPPRCPLRAAGGPAPGAAAPGLCADLPHVPRSHDDVRRCPGANRLRALSSPSHAETQAELP